MDIFISIHAPVKGATNAARRHFRHTQDFNPRTREGCDKNKVHPISRHYHFNPRTREGCDLSWPLPWHPGVLISIHAPVKGATSSGNQ